MSESGLSKVPMLVTATITVITASSLIYTLKLQLVPNATVSIDLSDTNQNLGNLNESLLSFDGSNPSINDEEEEDLGSSPSDNVQSLPVINTLAPSIDNDDDSDDEYVDEPAPKPAPKPST